MIHADEDKLRRTLVNLLSNAIKFTPYDGHVTVSVRHSAEGADFLFTVRDTGEGHSEEYLRAHLREVRPGREAQRRAHDVHRIGPDVLQDGRGSAWRAHLGRERAWQRQYFLVHHPGPFKSGLKWHRDADNARRDGSEIVSHSNKLLLLSLALRVSSALCIMSRRRPARKRTLNYPALLIISRFSSCQNLTFSLSAAALSDSLSRAS